MTRKQLQAALMQLGFKRLCDDNKTLVAYNEIQQYLKANRTPIKDVDGVYLRGAVLRVIISGYDDEISYTIDDENN